MVAGAGGSCIALSPYTTSSLRVHPVHDSCNYDSSTSSDPCSSMHLDDGAALLSMSVCNFASIALGLLIPL